MESLDQFLLEPVDLGFKTLHVLTYIFVVGRKLLIPDPVLKIRFIGADFLAINYTVEFRL